MGSQVPNGSLNLESDSTPSINNKFISQTAIDALSSNRKEEDPVYDPRTLYERLQEQRAIKDSEFKEASKFSNQIHRIDDDEFMFLENLQSQEQLLEQKRKQHEHEQLEIYKRDIDNLNQANSDPTKILSKIKPVEINSTRPPKRSLSILSGISKSIAKKKNSSNIESCSKNSKLDSKSNKHTISESSDRNTVVQNITKDGTDIIYVSKNETGSNTKGLVELSPRKNPDPLISLVDYSSDSQ
ncbi:hypothetical protein AYI68_g4407 [Smittium mucronatum]|uniref:FAM192A/Fyv6 N-terminal domain-containing protein n=1 Tax=Smittium mucronatum TaxID=133383 RepID=A0A1R0GX68_9FUNG|nr:hypothetical protein AYI68_g4407 [Smittium mucronatum]